MLRPMAAALCDGFGIPEELLEKGLDIIEAAVDEALAGHADRVDVTILPDNGPPAHWRAARAWLDER